MERKMLQFSEFIPVREMSGKFFVFFKVREFCDVSGKN